MKKKRSYPHRAIFLLAAEKQFASMCGEHINSEKFSCINLFIASEELGFRRPDERRGTENFYKRYFKPTKEDSRGSDVFVEVWWPRIGRNQEFDHESRIFALLFAAEMLRR